MARQLTSLADEVDATCDDDGCSVMSGIIRDCAYKIRNRAEQEREVRRMLGLWDNTTTEELELTRKG
jgi:ribosomal protein L11 methylase PrmA